MEAKHILLELCKDRYNKNKETVTQAKIVM